MDARKVEQDWRARGFSCDLWVDPPDRVWRDYLHDVDELLMVVEGELEVGIEGRIHRAKPGVELFIPAHARHTVRNIGGTTARLLYGYRTSHVREK
ncbi:MAG: cupin domain-containing protein [Candidatus Binataceae bacterium]